MTYSQKPIKDMTQEELKADFEERVAFYKRTHVTEADIKRRKREKKWRRFLCRIGIHFWMDDALLKAFGCKSKICKWCLKDKIGW